MGGLAASECECGLQCKALGVVTRLEKRYLSALHLLVYDFIFSFSVGGIDMTHMVGFSQRLNDSIYFNVYNNNMNELCACKFRNSCMFSNAVINTKDLRSNQRVTRETEMQMSLAPLQDQRSHDYGKCQNRFRAHAFHLLLYTAPFNPVSEKQCRICIQVNM